VAERFLEWGWEMRIRMIANILGYRPKLDSSMGIRISRLRIPTLDDDHGISSLRRRLIKTRNLPKKLPGERQKRDHRGMRHEIGTRDENTRDIG